MIQRIQTLYLLCAAGFIAATLFLPLAWFAGAGAEFELYAFALKSVAGEPVQPTWYLGILLVLTTVLPLLTIFLYKRRLLQLRLCVVELVLLVGVVAMEATYYFLSWRFFSDLSLHAQGFKPSIAVPLVSLLLVFFASRAILRDEMLVRAADRIR